MTTGPIAVGTTCYPDFVEGQVLTHNDLNLLRDFLYSHWAFQNSCLFGFGVACGLEGTIAGGDLKISTGFALAQDGRRLGLSAEATFVLSAVATGAVATSDYAFLEGAPGGYTAVLVADDTETAATETCTEALGCTAHTVQWCEGSKVVFAAGRLKVTDYTAGAAFQLSPVPVNAQNGVDATAFKKLQAALATALTNLVPGKVLSILTGYTLDSSQPGINLLKAGVLNEILFTLQDYERAKYYETGDCCGPSGQPAVALGWLDNGVWDCTYRHHFQLSTALYLAIQGYRCEDLCEQYIDHILDLIQNFVPPPPPEKPDDPPPPHKCTVWEYKTRRCFWWRPDQQIPEKVWPGYVAFDPTRQKPHYDPGDPTPWEHVQLGEDPYATVTTVNTIDPTNSGLVRLGDYLGFDGEASRGQLATAITGDVQVVDATKFGNVPGASLAVVAAASDTVVLGVDSATNRVVSTGVVPTAQTLQQVPAIGADASQAKTDAADAKGLAEQSWQSAESSAKSLSGLQESYSKLEGSWGEYQQTFNTRFSDFETGFAGMPDVGTLKQAAKLVENWSQIDQGYQNVKSGFDVLQGKFDAHDQQLALLGQHADTLAEKQADFAVKLEQAKSDVATQVTTATSGISDRVDHIGNRLDTQAVALSSGADVRRAGSVNATLTSALDALGAAIVRAAPKEQAGAVKEAVTQAQAGIETLRSEAAGLPVTETHPQVIADTMSSMLAAVEATGLNKHTNAYRDLTHSVNELGLALGTQISGMGG